MVIFFIPRRASSPETSDWEKGAPSIFFVLNNFNSSLLTIALTTSTPKGSPAAKVKPEFDEENLSMKHEDLMDLSKFFPSGDDENESQR